VPSNVYLYSVDLKSVFKYLELSVWSNFGLPLETAALKDVRAPSSWFHDRSRVFAFSTRRSRVIPLRVSSSENPTLTGDVYIMGGAGTLLKVLTHRPFSAFVASRPTFDTLRSQLMQKRSKAPGKRARSPPAGHNSILRSNCHLSLNDT